MPFWKKSEDPWDREPERRPQPSFEQQPEKPDGGILDQLKDWNEARKAEQARKAAEETPDPIPCPWCGKMMEPGQLTGGQGVYWASGFPTTREKWIGSPQREQVRVDNQGVFYVYQTAWFCENCRKLVVDFPEPPVYTPAFGTDQNEYEQETNKREGEN